MDKVSRENENLGRNNTKFSFKSGKVRDFKNRCSLTFGPSFDPKGSKLGVKIDEYLYRKSSTNLRYFLVICLLLLTQN